MLARERTWYSDADIRAKLMRIWQVMQDCVRRGFEAQGLLPGVLGVRRRAPKLYRQLMSGDPASPMHALDWVNVYALAVKRGKRRRRPGCHGTDQRRGRHRARGAALLPPIRTRRRR